jgi:adenine-specific DNA-methyltransferase
MPELNWLGDRKARQAARHVQYRLLQPVADVGEPGSENLLIQGDNLDALKSLLPLYAGRVKCIFIDPPYNTRSAFEHYDDNLEHSQWLSMMYARLVLLRELLSEDGSIWVTIDDNEAHYLKVVMDEVFGRGNFIADITWHKTSSVHNNADYFSSSSDHVFVFSRNLERFTINRVPRSARNAEDYGNQDDDPRGAWTTSPLHVSLTSGQRGAQFARSGTSSGLFTITSPHGEAILPPPGRAWGYSQESLAALEKDDRIWCCSNHRVGLRRCGPQSRGEI